MYIHPTSHPISHAPTNHGTTAVLLCEANAEQSPATPVALAEYGLSLAGLLEQPEDIFKCASEIAADVIVLATGRVDDALIQVLRNIPEEARRPLVLCSRDLDDRTLQAALEAGVNAYIGTGVVADGIPWAIEFAKAAFARDAHQRSELDNARIALRERKIIERAKGIVMKKMNLDEDAAYQLLRTRAMRKGLRLAAVATMINEAADVME